MQLIFKVRYTVAILSVETIETDKRKSSLRNDQNTLKSINVATASNRLQRLLASKLQPILCSSPPRSGLEHRLVATSPMPNLKVHQFLRLICKQSLLLATNQHRLEIFK